jgi:hypothetical protein
MSYQASGQPSAQSGGNNRTIIIVIIVVLVLCCCCAVLAGGLYVYGDQLRALISTPVPTTPLLLKLMA